ncbi:MAG: hypothetical protein DHS20C13_06300 [Thermodesulfobacteriota bacterium]|nr:MAG: hypothetical protein DHS20C13_06300 [Thermodesulfobacteriota bacterium]
MNFCSNKAKIPPNKAGTIYIRGVVLMFVIAKVPEKITIPNNAPNRKTPAE